MDDKEVAIALAVTAGAAGALAYGAYKLGKWINRTDAAPEALIRSRTDTVVTLGTYDVLVPLPATFAPLPGGIGGM